MAVQTLKLFTGYRKFLDLNLDNEETALAAMDIAASNEHSRPFSFCIADAGSCKLR